MTFDAKLDGYLKDKKKLVDQALEAYLPAENVYPSALIQAVRYSLFAGGKRIRPVLCLAAAETVGGDIKTTLPVACALEMIHTYSLIHDDLPAMDNDDVRRGKPTNHKVFGEAVAILAGDALLTEAFHLMARTDLMPEIDPAKLLVVVRDIAQAAGYDGMVGGQTVDILSEGRQGDPDTLNYIHYHKTAALIAVSLKSGALLAGANTVEVNALEAYGHHIGLAFQIADDLLNVEGNKELLGKNTGSDRERGKLAYPALVGVEVSRQKAFELTQAAIEDVALFEERALPLRWIAEYVVERSS
ncbi:MAG: polyprenyl synthetase family protein [Deltaproteobacteria bacterium]|nr:polyprenyl synthetase family protein [Deltaproteobacteria bacterium]